MSDQPPYPVSPVTPEHQDSRQLGGSSSNLAAGSWQHSQGQLRPQASIPSISDMDDGWSDGDVEKQEPHQIVPVIPEASDSNVWSTNELDIPSSLRAGPPHATGRSSFESQRSQESERPRAREAAQSYLPSENTNPYRRRSAERGEADVKPKEESSVDIWADLGTGPPPTSAPPPIPPLPNEVLVASSAAPLGDDAWARLDDTFSGLHLQDKGKGRLSEDHNTPLDLTDHTAALSASFEGWAQPTASSDGSPKLEPESDSQDLETFATPVSAAALLDRDAVDVPPQLADSLDDAPPLPPRRATEHVYRQHISPELAAQQRAETYQIKHIRWHDAKSFDPIRTSPVMLQNANGPCPLLALVNALTLSTPAGVDTALTETLRVREQISLGLLLDAVFDELMSGRRGSAAQELPDVTELYAFLVNLHTGMNVNPMFVPSPQPLLIDHDLDSPEPRDEAMALGTFELTREMELYGAFSILLIHGWLPATTHPAFKALRRSAKSYEDAQNLMFREEELEDKLQGEGLDEEEQALLSDISSIKFFLSTSATQLTSHGLDAMLELLAPGSISILFRNDHFSTLYKHPITGQLFTLVTDMGYASHDEIVWESLVDTTGEHCEFLAGDFRPVGFNAPVLSPAPSSEHQPWTTVTRGRQNHSAHPLPAASNENIPPASTEQEDADLALAMQLQEEEEDRSRRETAARRREDALSQAFLDTQAREGATPAARTQGRHPAAAAASTPTSSSTRPQPNSTPSQIIRPLVPPRGGSTTIPITRTTAGTTTASPRPVDPEAGEDAPPPSYEQASKTLPYNPPNEQPLSPAQAGPAQASRPRAHHQGGSYAQQQQQHQQGARTPGRGQGRGLVSGLATGDGLGTIRRHNGGPGVAAGATAAEQEERNKDCVVM